MKSNQENINTVSALENENEIGVFDKPAIKPIEKVRVPVEKLHTIPNKLELVRNGLIVEMSKKEKDVRLEKEFSVTQHLKLREEDLEYCLVNPDENMGKGDPIVLVGGFATAKEQYKREIINLARIGKKVIFLNPDKGITPSEVEEKYFNEMKDALPATIAKKGAAVLALLEYLHIEKADIVGSSQGAAVATAIAGAHPEKVKRLVLDSPAGMIGKDSIIDLMRRTTKDAIQQKGERTIQKHLIHEKLREYDADVWKKYFKKVKKFLPWRLFREVPDIPKIDLRPALARLKKVREDSGVGPEIVLFNADSDVVFPHERIEKALGDNPFLYIDSWAMYANRKQKHSKYTQPQPMITPEQYNTPGRDSAIYQLFSSDPDVKIEKTSEAVSGKYY